MQAGLHLRVYKQRVKKFLSKEEFQHPDACIAVARSMQVTQCEHWTPLLPASPLVLDAALRREQ